MTRAKKRFGQHFLADPDVIDDIVAAIAPAADDVVVEIGPGHGAITAPIVARCGRYHGIELDRELAARLETRFAANERVTIHQGDALAFDFGALGSGLRIVGNLPYNISTPLLFRLLDFRDRIADMHFMLQKEVVDRIVAGPGSRRFGRLGIMLGCYLEAYALFPVDPRAFAPPPRVTSAVVRLRPASRHRIADAGLLSRIVATAFSQRRKTLRNALKSLVCEDDLVTLGIDPGLRPENIAIADWVAIANRLAAGTDTAPRTR